MGIPELHKVTPSNPNKLLRNGKSWQSVVLNSQEYYKALSWLEALALNRFEWEGLPDSCDSRYLERSLLHGGMCAIAKNRAGIWHTLRPVTSGDLTVYGLPASWEMMGEAGRVRYWADWSTGAIVWDSESRLSPWPTLSSFAFKLAHLEIAERTNVLQQSVPYVFTGPVEKKTEIENAVAASFAGSPAIVGEDGFTDFVKVSVLATPVEYHGEHYAAMRENLWREAYRFLGIQHMPFEKASRLIVDEVAMSDAPTLVRRRDSLRARERAAAHVSKILGSPVSVRFVDVGGGGDGAIQA